MGDIIYFSKILQQGWGTDWHVLFLPECVVQALPRCQLQREPDINSQRVAHILLDMSDVSKVFQA